MILDFQLEKTSLVPLHVQLAEALRRRVARMRPGERLCSEQTICRKYQLSRATVTRALNALAKDGYIRRSRGSGTFVENPAPAVVYFLLPCIDAVKICGAGPVMHAYAGALRRCAKQGCRLEALIASPVNQWWQVDREVVSSLPPESRVIVASAWFCELFEDLRRCRHRVAFIDMQSGLTERHRRFTEGWEVLTIDRYRSMLDLVAWLHRCGRRRIAFLHYFQNYQNPLRRGFHDGLKACGLPDCPDLELFAGWEKPQAESDFMILFRGRKEVPFDAVITGCHSQARAVSAQLRRCQVPVPEEVMVVSLNMHLEAASEEFPGLEWPFEQAGETAVDILQETAPEKPAKEWRGVLMSPEAGNARMCGGAGFENHDLT